MSDTTPRDMGHALDIGGFVGDEVAGMGCMRGGPAGYAWLIIGFAIRSLSVSESVYGAGGDLGREIGFAVGEDCSALEDLPGNKDDMARLGWSAYEVSDQAKGSV